MSKSTGQNQIAPFVAGILAWLIPGAGHVYLGRTLRGIILCLCINGLFWSGVAMGGVFTVEPLRQRWWFAAQMSTGISGGVTWYNQQRYRQKITGESGMTETPGRRDASRWWGAYTRALHEKNLALVYPTDAVARAYTGIAGMLNLMCIFDAAMLALLGRFGEPSSAAMKKERPA